MKKFEMPTMDVEKFDIPDIITTSVDPDDGCGNDCGSNACPFD